MIERNLYLKQVLPFIDQDIIKVITGMHLFGKYRIYRTETQRL